MIELVPVSVALRGEVDRYRALSKRMPMIALDPAVEPWWKLWKRGGLR